MRAGATRSRRRLSIFGLPTFRPSGLAARRFLATLAGRVPGFAVGVASRRRPHVR